MNYLQFNDKGKFDKEEKALANYFDSIKQPYKGFYKKHFLRDRFQITKEDFIAGDVDVMLHAFKRLGIGYSYNDYPDLLKPYLHRKVWESTLGNIRRELLETKYFDVPIFIKPKDKLKRFTGFVCIDVDDLQNAKGGSAKDLERAVKSWEEFVDKTIEEDTKEIERSWKKTEVHNDLKGLRIHQKGMAKLLLNQEDLLYQFKRNSADILEERENWSNFGLIISDESFKKVEDFFVKWTEIMRKDLLN